MVANALFATTVIFLGFGLVLLGECRFLVPYRDLLVQRYGTVILGFAATLFVNLFAVIYFLTRKLFLKDTGRKLAHVEKQIRSNGSISEELARMLDN